MSFRELRNFTEMMRALGYPRPISVENFRTPNFELVSDVLHWMVKKYDPNCSIWEEIETEEDRIEFLTSVGSMMLNKARIKLNLKKLYGADGYAVKELLKIAKVLYDASRIDPTSMGDDDDINMSSMLGSRLKDTKAIRMLSSEITERGAKLYDLLDKELETKKSREEAIAFLDTVSANLDNTPEYAYLEKNVRQIIQSLHENLEILQKQQAELEMDEKQLDTKIKKKKTDLERGEKRLKSLKNVRPAFMDEYEKLEKDLEGYYEIYCVRHRNLDYLEHELNLYDKREQERMQENDRSLKRMQEKLRNEELRILRGEVDDIDGLSSPDVSKSKSKNNRKVTGSMDAENDDSDEGSNAASSSSSSRSRSPSSKAASDDDSEKISLGKGASKEAASDLGSDDDDDDDVDESGSDAGSGSFSGSDSKNESDQDF